VDLMALLIYYMTQFGKRFFWVNCSSPVVSNVTIVNTAR
jgi:hypothetical protein